MQTHRGLSGRFAKKLAYINLIDLSDWKKTRPVSFVVYDFGHGKAISGGLGELLFENSSKGGSLFLSKAQGLYLLSPDDFSAEPIELKNIKMKTNQSITLVKQRGNAVVMRVTSRKSSFPCYNRLQEEIIMKKNLALVFLCLALLPLYSEAVTKLKPLKAGEWLECDYGDDRMRTLYIYKSNGSQKELYCQTENAFWGNYRMADTKRTLVFFSGQVGMEEAYVFP